ncbi:choice-of-anchor X domain-containing protein [Candidatus Hydrogenedentota bacterium]
MLFRIIAVGLLLVCGALLDGCATPEVDKAPIIAASAIVTQSIVKPGGRTVLAVRVYDPGTKVSSVKAYLREYPDFAVDLVDDGTRGDTVANDGVWSREIETDEAAADGVYNWDFQALNATGAKVTSGDEPVATVGIMVTR